jgi:oxygen-independent coproporphyrinogen-3 oxidase
VLETIGRRHTAEDIERALSDVRKVGIPAVNMDLIAGLPSDTPEGFERTLNRVLALAPENITVHTLALKKGSRITLSGTALPSEDDVARMLDMAAARLTHAGYEPYYLYRQKYMSGGFENVGWCKPGFENIYNVVMMEELHSVIALGGGGATKLIRPGSGKIERIFNQKYPKEYIESIQRNIEEKQYIQEFYNDLQFSGDK